MKNTNERATVKNGKSPLLLLDKFKLSEYKWICLSLFVFIAYYLTVIHNKSFLIKVQELSLFLPTSLFFEDNMKTAGGLLAYIGTFFTQFFYVPWLGSTIYIFLLLLIRFLVSKAYRIPFKFYALSFLPSAMLLLSFTELGYVIYTLKSPGYIYSNLIGIIVALSFFWGYRSLKPAIIRTLSIAVFIMLGYPLFGFYALFSAFLCILYEIISFIRDKNINRFFTVITAIFFVCVIPYLYYVYIYSQMLFDMIYIAGLPAFDFTKVECTLWLPFILIFSCLLAFLTFLFKQPGKKFFDSYFVVATLIYMLSLFGVHYYSFDDENFRAEINMDIAIMNDDWNRVLKIAEKLKGEPTRLLVMDTNLALQKLGIAGDNMFRYKNGSKPYNSLRPHQLLLHAGAKAHYFQYGKINFCYRWCMEDNVEYGMKVEYLKYMVKCALLNREFPLAKKYNDVLMKTWFHKNWAKKYERYIDDPALILLDPEFMTVMPLMAYDNILDGDSGLLEVYLLNNFGYMQGGPPDLVELSIQSNLLLKNIERFWPRFYLYARTHDRIPVHYQEAALLYSYLERKVDINNVRIDPLIAKRFESLIKMSETFGNQPEELSRDMIKPYFGDTFWYYYFFVKNLKTN